MLKKKLSCILAVITATSIFSTVGFAQTEEKKLFGDTFENGLNSEIWNIMPDSGLGEVRSDQIKYLKTSATENAEFTYEYSAEKEDVSFDISVNAAEWKQDGEAFEVYVRYVDAANYFKLTYTPSNGTFTLLKCVGGVETPITTAEKQLAAGTDYKISLQAKHGVVRFELDGITLIQDYTGIDNFNKEAASNYAKFKTLSQELKITNLNIREEDTLLHQKFANTGWIMTDSDGQNDSDGISFKTKGTYTPQADSLLISGAQEARIQQSDWEYSDKGTDFARTEATFVMRIDNGPDDVDASGGNMGWENLHFRTCVNANNAAMYLAKIWRDGYALGDNYGQNKHNEAVKKDGYGHNYGFRPYANDGKYHTYRVVTEPNSDFSKVTMTLYIDGDEHLKWEDDAPVTYNPEEWPDRILAGGFELATTQSVTKLSLKSYELRDITGSDKSIYTESFNSTDNWTNTEIVTVGENADKYYITTENDNGMLVVSDKNWKNIEAETDVKFDSMPSNASLENYAGIIARYVNANNYIMGAYSPYASEENKGTVFIQSMVNGTASTIASKEIPAFEADTIHKIGISVKDGSAIILVDGKAVLNAPISTNENTLYGSVALKSNNLATKFDNVIVTGTPYYFVEEFNYDSDWSAYKVGNSTSGVNNVTLNNDGTITTTNKTEIYLYADENSTGSWDDVEMTIKMKTNATDLSGMYIRGGVDGTNANYYIENAETSKLGLNAKWGTVLANTPGTVSVPNDSMFEVKLRLTDEKTADGKDAVRIRYTVNGVEQINYLDDGSVAKGVTENNPDVKALLDQYPLTAASHGRGFSIVNTSDRINVIDSITIRDPEAGDVIANISAPETFAANEDITAKLTVDNKSYETVEAMFIIALYNGDEIIDATVTYPQTAADKKEEYTMKINSGAATKMKVFAWDGWDTMIPIAQSVVANLAAQQTE